MSGCSRTSALRLRRPLRNGKFRLHPYRDTQRGVTAKLRIYPHGYWISQDGIDQQAFDHSVCSTLTQFFKSHGASVVDFGCANGAYVRAFSAAGLRCDGYDGNPLTERMTDGGRSALDLSLPVELETTYDWVLSLEVGEHIPSEFEDSFLGNIDRHNRKGVILSWASLARVDMDISTNEATTTSSRDLSKWDIPTTTFLNSS